MVVPILVKQRVVNLVYAHTLSGLPPPQLVDELTELGARAQAAYLRLIRAGARLVITGRVALPVAGGRLRARRARRRRGARRERRGGDRQRRRRFRPEAPATPVVSAEATVRR